MKIMNNGEPRSDYEIDERAAEASALLNNPIINEAFDTYRNELTSALINSKIGSDEAMEAHACLLALDKIRVHLIHTVNDQKMARKFREKNDG